MKILVTGAAGFIGLHVARLLLERGDEVIGIDNLNDYYDPGLKRARLDCLEPYRNFRFVAMDIADDVVAGHGFLQKQVGGAQYLVAAPSFPKAEPPTRRT